MLFLGSCDDDDTPPATPAIASLSPASGYAGTAVTITGSDFSASPSEITVKFGAQTATVTTSTATQVVTAVPSGIAPGTVSVTVTVGGRESNGKEFTITATPPSITSIAPAQGPAGTVVTITGVNFATGNGSVVKFGTTLASVTQASATQIITSVPAGIAVGAYAITVTVGSETATSTQNFTVTPVPAPSLYWIGADAGQFQIMKGAPNGSGDFMTSLLYPGTMDATVTGMTRDHDSKYIYWAEQILNFDTYESESTIWRGDTLGSEPTAIAGPLDGLKEVDAMAIDYENGKLCWIDANTLWRANLDGTEPEQLFSGASFERLLAIAVNSSHLYFIETGSVVYQGLLNGTGDPVAIIDPTDIPAAAGTSNTLVGITATDESLFFACKPDQTQDKSEILKATIQAAPTLSMLYQSTTTETNPLNLVLGVTMDPETGYLYWINMGGDAADNGSIYRGSSETTGTPERVLNGLSLPSLGKNPVNGRPRRLTKSPVNLSF